MKTVSTTLKDSIRKDYVLNAVPRVIADWNNNYYYAPTADNDPTEESQGFDVEQFPIESIYGSNRPTKGIAKARVNQSIVSSTYASNNEARFYMGSENDLYKYWTSPVQTNGSGVFPLHTDGDTIVKPFVLYNAPAVTNKIVVKLENSWATPLSYDIRIKTTVGGAWSTIATNPTIRNDGQIIIYYNGTGWSSTKPTILTNTRNVAGIQLRVYSLTSGRKPDGTVTTYDTYATPPEYVEEFDVDGNLIPIDYSAAGSYVRKNTNGSNSNFDLIAIEGHLEADLSDRVISTELTEEVGEASFLYPIGTINTNSGSITLSNEDRIFNKDNASSPYKNILEANTNFNIEYVYTVGSTEYVVQGCNMYGGAWTGQKTSEVSVSIDDYSKYFQNSIPLAAMWENLTVPQVIWRVLDSIGFVNYNIDVDDRTEAHSIPVYWCDGIKTVMEILDELAQASQTAIYFDAYGVLQVKTRDSAFNAVATPVWTLRGENSGDELADIIDLDQTEEFEANNVTVSYQTTDWTDYNNGQPTLQTVWQPDDTIALRASQLTTPIFDTTQYIWLTPKNAQVWPWTAMVNIESEIMSYEGKQYVYYTGTVDAPVRHVEVVIDADAQKALDALSGDLIYKNHLTGALKIKERELWNSEKIDHLIDVSGWRARTIQNGVKKVDTKGFVTNAAPSIAQMTNTGKGVKSTHDILVASRGLEADFPPHFYGARFRFTGKYADEKGGIAMLINGSHDDGVYINITPTANISNTERAKRDEIMLYNRQGGSYSRLGSARTAIFVDKWIDIDAYFHDSGTKQTFRVYFNGKLAIESILTGSDRQPSSGEYGIYVAGQTRAWYEYFYALSRPVDEPPDDVSYWDTIHSGYAGSLWDREWTYGWLTRTRRIRKKNVVTQSKYNQKMFDDFGPWVHEIREFDVKFDPAPVLHSRLFSTDEWNAVVLDYRGSPFGAKWTMANAAREIAIISGDDSATFDSTEDVVNQQMIVFGRVLVISDAETIVVKDDAAIQKRGKIDTDLTSDWIQNKAMAQAVADWIVAHWSQGQDEVSATIFGNPLFELTDVVSVSYVQKDMTTATHKYFVVGISSSFSAGLQTTLTLRRVRA